jgi:hypothetical protein
LKTWRRLTYDGISYRWIVEDKQTQEGADTFTRSIIIQAEDPPGAQAVFVSDVIGRLRLYSSSHPLVVRTALVRACIRYALQNGWDPAASEPDFHAELTAELLARIDQSNGGPGQGR